jgi:hypothetical protein
MGNNLIKQINIANHGVYPFSKDLIDRYDLTNYYNENLPCFFWGVIGETHKINNHKSLKIVKFLTPADCDVISCLINDENLFIINDPFIKEKKDYCFVDLEFEYKNYDIFKPKILGDKIYCYMRDSVEFQKNFLDEIQKKINYEIIYGGLISNAEYYDNLEALKKNYYDKCFLSINLSSRHGYTTVRELGYMGIKTIMKSPYNFPSIVQLKETITNIDYLHMQHNEDEIINLINLESKKINTLQKSLNCHNINDEWINVSFWEKEYEKYTSR